MGFLWSSLNTKLYNKGESTRHIDWKLFAKTEKLYTKKYEEETNLRCHLIVDNSASMHYPEVKTQSLDNLNKIGFLGSGCGFVDGSFKATTRCGGFEHLF